MLKNIIVICIFSCVAAAAHAATCDAGYWPDETKNGACAACPLGYYCDGDARHQCPPATVDATLARLATTHGFKDIIVTSGISIYSWGLYGGPAQSLTDCYQDMYISSDRGLCLLEKPWNTSLSIYWADISHCYLANPGFYLSVYFAKSQYAWYKTILPCTNAPSEHAHYTGPGDPDTDNCPWECDCGYVRSGDVCVPASECTAGVKTLRTGTGLIYKLYSTQTTSPTIAIGLNGNVCYACLAPGAADGALNLEWDAGIFHAINGN